MNPVDSPKSCTAEGLTDAAGDRAKNCIDAGVEALNAATAKARALTQNADKCVHANPWLTIGAAAGLGLFVGFLLRGHRD